MSVFLRLVEWFCVLLAFFGAYAAGVNAGSREPVGDLVSVVFFGAMITLSMLVRDWRKGV